MCVRLCLLESASLQTYCIARSIILIQNVFHFMLTVSELYCGSLLSLIRFTPGQITPPVHSGAALLYARCVDAPVPPSTAWPEAGCRCVERERRLYMCELWNGKKVCSGCNADKSEPWGDATSWEGCGRKRCIWKGQGRNKTKSLHFTISATGQTLKFSLFNMEILLIIELKGG